MDSGLEKLRNALSVATAGMDVDALQWHPPGKWCVAEILEHLYLTYSGTIKGFEKVIMAGKPLATEPSVRQRLRALVSVGIGFIPEGRRSPKSAEPRGLPYERVRAEVDTKIAAMDEIMVKCEMQFGAGVRILDHPILGGLTGAQWRKFHLVHGLHHVKQIRRLQEAMKTISKN